MEKIDLTGTTSKRKFRRYFQAQEALFGLNWKRIVEKQRIEVHQQIQPHGFQAWDEMTEDGHAPIEEDLFPSDYLELERILACDESNMYPKIFVHQRMCKPPKGAF